MCLHKMFQTTGHFSGKIREYSTTYHSLSIYYLIILTIDEFKPYWRISFEHLSLQVDFQIISW